MCQRSAHVRSGLHPAVRHSKGPGSSSDGCAGSEDGRSGQSGTHRIFHHESVADGDKTGLQEIKTPADLSAGVREELITGIEPVTSSLPRMRTTDCAISAFHRKAT